jgi:uridine kinase
VITSPFFYIPLFLKILAGSFLASSFATELFVPFLTHFSTHPLSNPYETFLLEGKTNAFPYPFGMLTLLSFPYLVFSSIVTEYVSPVNLFLLRATLLLADLSILTILLAWFRDKTKDVLVLYWMSPILFYITYIHGQLDSIPIAFLFLSLYFISKKRDVAGLVFFGIACTTKMSSVLVLPLIFLYLFKEREKTRMLFIKMLTPFVVFFLINIPMLFSNGFYELVFKTKEQFKVFDLFFVYSETLRVYIVPFVLLLLMLYVARLKRYTRNILIAFLTISFISLLLLIPPRQGWYFWIIPFIVYLYVQLPASKRVSLHLLSFAYFVYFAITPDSDFLEVASLFSFEFTHTTLYLFLQSHGLPISMFVNLSFTLLQASLLFVGYTVYRYGLLEYTRQKLYYKPFIIGIAGDSGSGKTTLASSLSSVFSSFHTAIIKGDDMHKWERGHEKWKEYTHLDPLANDLHSEMDTLRKVTQDEPFSRKVYDHDTGTFTAPKKITPKRLVIFEGLHAFFLEKIRKSFDIRVYVSPEEQLRLHWKIIRDTSKRGYSKEKVLDVIEERKDDSASYISVQEKHADIIFSLRNKISLGDTLGNKDVILTLSLFITCSNDINVESFLQAMLPYTSVEYAIADKQQTVKVTGKITACDIETIATRLFNQLDDITDEQPVWKDGYEGVMQLFTIFYIFETLKLTHHEAR